VLVLALAIAIVRGLRGAERHRFAPWRSCTPTSSAHTHHLVAFLVGFGCRASSCT